MGRLSYRAAFFDGKDYYHWLMTFWRRQIEVFDILVTDL